MWTQRLNEVQHVERGNFIYAGNDYQGYRNTGIPANKPTIDVPYEIQGVGTFHRQAAPVFDAQGNVVEYRVAPVRGPQGSGNAGTAGAAPLPDSGMEPFNENWANEPGGAAKVVDWSTRRQLEMKRQEGVAGELAKGQAKPVNEAIERGTTAQKEIQLLNSLEVLSRQTSPVFSGPLADLFVETGKGLSELTGGYIGADWTGPAEAVSKLNSALASLAAREITNRPALAEFSNMIRSNPGLANSPAGRQLLIDVLRQGAQQDTALSQMAAKVKDPTTWADVREAYLKKNPIRITYGGKTYTADKEGISQLKDDLAGATPPPPDEGWKELGNGVRMRVKP